MIQKIRYYFSTIAENGKRTSQKYKKERLFVLLDMLWCAIRYSASPSNYYYFGFAKLNHSQRQTYVTHKMSEAIQKKYNSLKYHIVFYDKMIFSRVFSDFYGRRCLSTETMQSDDFEQFVTSCPKFLYKPLEGGQGKGIQVFENTRGGVHQFYTQLKNTHGILEEWICQHPTMQALYPNAVNIVRVQTIYDKNECHFLCATLTAGHHNQIANASSNSIFALVDVKTGKVFTDGCDYSGHVYIDHPETGIRFKGFEIPMWNQVLEMLKKAAARVPQIGYVGWDIAITENGPVLIEGNNDGGYVGYQLAELCNGHGQKEVYQPFLE